MEIVLGMLKLLTVFLLGPCLWDQFKATELREKYTHESSCMDGKDLYAIFDKDLRF